MVPYWPLQIEAFELEAPRFEFAFSKSNRPSIFERIDFFFGRWSAKRFFALFPMDIEAKNSSNLEKKGQIVT